VWCSGGWKKDDEVIACADQHGIAVVFTGKRLFYHENTTFTLRRH